MIGFEIIVTTQPSAVVLVGTREVICSILALRRMMRENPELAMNNGELASQTQIHWIDLIVGQDLYYRECLLLKMAKFKRELFAESNGTLKALPVIFGKIIAVRFATCSPPSAGKSGRYRSQKGIVDASQRLGSYHPDDDR
jgi:hypothetical protein